MQADGHPIGPGSAGENLTTEGIEWATLPIGTRAAIGDRVVLEISKPDMPCDTIAGAFSDGRSGRISILTHPLDSRMYARVLVEGEVRPGDAIRLLPPLADSQAELHDLLDRIEAVARAFNVSLWQATAEAGFDVRLVDDGELAMVASPRFPGRSFNRVSGHRELPNLLPRMVDWFQTNGAPGWIAASEPPWPGAEPERRSSIHAAEPSAIHAAAVAAGATSMPGDLAVREIGAADAATFADVLVEASSIDDDEASAWRGAIPRMVGLPGHHYLLVEDGRRPVAVGQVTVRRRVGVLAMMAVLPSYRGRGIQRALVAHRAALAAGLDATIVAAGAHVDGVSSTNLRATGLPPIWGVALYRCDPDDPALRTIAARAPAASSAG